MSQETQTGALYQPRGVRWKGDGREVQEGGDICIPELLIAKFRLKLKKVGKTTRLFRYDLNQMPYDYKVEMTNRLNRLDLIECLKNYGRRSVTLYRRQ